MKNLFTTKEHSKFRFSTKLLHCMVFFILTVQFYLPGQNVTNTLVVSSEVLVQGKELQPPNDGSLLFSEEFTPRANIEPIIILDPSVPKLENTTIIAAYGHPRSTRMGMLGELSKEELMSELLALAQDYDRYNGDRSYQLAFHIIYATAYDTGQVGYLRDEMVMEYIRFAQSEDILIFLDHQIGAGGMERAVTSLLPWLQYENVHLAFDPEWATTIPGQEIGGVHAQDINNAMERVSRYLEENSIDEQKLLVVHQFARQMIGERDQVEDNYENLELIHNADGFGSPALKRSTFRFLVEASNMPHKGFKLFLPKSWRSYGYDDPLMSPAEVMNLVPRPVYINYQ